MKEMAVQQQLQQPQAFGSVHAQLGDAQEEHSLDSLSSKSEHHQQNIDHELMANFSMLGKQDNMS